MQSFWNNIKPASVGIPRCQIWPTLTANFSRWINSWYRSPCWAQALSETLMDFLRKSKLFDGVIVKVRQTSCSSHYWSWWYVTPKEKWHNHPVSMDYTITELQFSLRWNARVSEYGFTFKEETFWSVKKLIKLKPKKGSLVESNNIDQ